MEIYHLFHIRDLVVTVFKQELQNYRDRILEIDHLHYDVKAQRLLVVVVKFAGKHHFWLMIG